ncbi:1626_t:CDS:2 [Entrophospora sp. SA101]|nr:1626_t:CDS:2 [Entrophospora sp. SA101]
MAQLKTQIPALALFFLLNNLLVKQVISYPLLKTNGGNVDVMLPNDHLLKRQITTKAIKMGLKAAKRLILKYNVVLIILIVVRKNEKCRNTFNPIFDYELDVNGSDVRPTLNDAYTIVLSWTI